MGPGGQDARRLRVTTAVAAAAHLLGLALIATRPAPVAAPSPPPAEVAPILVELEREPPVLPPPEPVPVAVPPAGIAEVPGGRSVPRRAPGAPAVVAGGSRGDTAPGSAGEEVITAAPIPEAPAGSARASATPDRLPPPLLPLAIHAPVAVLAAPLGAVQAPSMLTAGGQVMATAQKLAEGSGPQQGHGTLRITVEEDGSVSGVVVSGVGWEAAAQRIRAALAGRRLRVPKGAHGVVISLALDARVTRVPPVLTGEARAGAVGFDADPGGLGDNHSGFGLGAPNGAVIDPTALAPLRRRVVKVELVGEQPR